MIKYIGKHTIAFYFLSASIPFACCKVVERFLHFESALASVLVFLAEFLLSFFVAFVIVYLLNKYLPFLFDVRKLKNVNQ